MVAFKFVSFEGWVCVLLGVLIRSFERGLGNVKAGFGFSGQNEEGLVLVLRRFEVVLTGEEGGTAIDGRPPPSSPAGSRLHRRTFAECEGEL